MTPGETERLWSSPASHNVNQPSIMGIKWNKKGLWKIIHVCYYSSILHEAYGHRLTVNAILLLQFTVISRDERMSVHTLVPGLTIFQNTVVVAMFVPEVLEPAGIFELSGVYVEYLLAHLLLPERK